MLRVEEVLRPKVHNGAVGADSLTQLAWLSDQSIWKFGKKSTKLATTHFWSCTAYNHELSPTMTFEEAIVHRQAFAPVQRAVEELRESCLGDEVIERVYFNAQTTGLDGEVHYDVPPPTQRRTTLVYCHRTWKEEWGGELEFFHNDSGELSNTVSPGVGVVVDFNAGLPHRARAPRTAEAGLRVVLVVKSRPPDRV